VSILGFGAKVILTYEAKTDQARAEIKKLQGVEKEAAEARLAGMEKSNKKIEAQVKAIGMAAAAFAAVTVGIGLADKALDAYGRQNFQAAEKVKKLRDNLDRLGDKFGGMAGEVVASFEPVIDVFTRLSSALADIAGFFDAGGALSAVAKYGIPIYGQVLMARDGLGIGKGSMSDQAMEHWRRKQAANAALGNASAQIGAAGDAMSPWRDAGVVFTDGIRAGIRNAREKATFKKGDGSATKLGADVFSDLGGAFAQSIVDQLLEHEELTGQEFGGGAAIDTRANDRSYRSLQRQKAHEKRQYTAGVDDRYADFQAGIEANKTNVVDRMFGPVDQFAPYQAAFGALADTATGAYEAIVTGSEPAGQAIKRLAGQGIMALGKTMFVEGIKHTAQAIGSLASYNYPAAALHASAAAKNFAGAAIAGAVASGMGGGGGMPSGGGAGARPSAPSYNGPSNSGSSERSAPVIVVGSPFAYDSPRNQQKNAKRLTGLALGTNSVVYG